MKFRSTSTGESSGIPLDAKISVPKKITCWVTSNSKLTYQKHYFNPPGNTVPERSWHKRLNEVILWEFHLLKTTYLWWVCSLIDCTFLTFFLPQYLNVISDRESSQLQVSSILFTYLDLSWFVPGTTSCIPSIDSSKAFCAVLARPKIESPFFSLRVTSMQFHHTKRPIHKIPQGNATHIPKQNHMNQPDWTRFFFVFLPSRPYWATAFPHIKSCHLTSIWSTNSS